MKQLKKFMVYLDDGENCYKIAIPAENEEEARKYVSGNGEIIAVKDVTEQIRITTQQVKKLLSEGMNEKEIDFILRTLQNTCIIE